MPHIPLKNSAATAAVDEQDFERLNAFTWVLCGQGYAYREQRLENGHRIKIYMHRDVMNFPRGFDVDHIDGDRLNNKRVNLRAVTKQQNQFNRGAIPGSTSPYKGVSLYKKKGLWRASIRVDGKSQHLGLFRTEVEAAAAYNAVAVSLHGEYARLNDVEALPDWQAHRVTSRRGGASQYLGVYPQGKKWKAAIRHKGRQIYLGLFVDEISAAEAYNRAAMELKGLRAKLNALGVAPCVT